MKDDYRLLTNEQMLSFVQRILETTEVNEYTRQHARNMVVEVRRRMSRRRDDHFRPDLPKTTE